MAKKVKSIKETLEQEGMEQHAKHMKSAPMKMSKRKTKVATPTS